MSKTIEEAREKQRVLFEGHTRFAEIKTEFFEDLMDIQRQPENLSCSDYCKIGFSHGYLEGYMKAKGEAQPEPKTGNSMPEILPGYIIRERNTKVAVLKNDHNRLWIFNCEVPLWLDDKDKITEIWDRDGLLIWSKE